MKNSNMKDSGEAKKQEVILSTLSSLPDLFDSEKCTKWLIAKIHPEGPACNVCRSPLDEKRACSYKELRRLRCSACGNQFNAWTGTFMQGSHITPIDFMLMRTALAAGLEIAEIMRLTGRHRQLVASWTRKVQQFNETYGEVIEE